jgi:hypothetical protein
MREKKMKDKNAPRSSGLNFPFPNFLFQQNRKVREAKP